MSEPWDTERIREAFIYDGGEAAYYDPISGASEQRRIAGGIFDAWLAAYTAEKQAEALQFASKAIQGRVDPKATHCAMYVNAGLLLACDELSDRAQRLREQATNQQDRSTT